MKKKLRSRKVLTSLLVITMMVTSLSTSFAQGTTAIMDAEMQKSIELLSDLKEINRSIESNNVDVVYELEQMKKDMVDRLNETDDVELIAQMKAEIEHYDYMIGWYPKNSLDKVISNYENSESVSPMSVDPLQGIRAGIIAMIAGGRAIGLNLAAELLSHSMIATPDSTYTTSTRTSDMKASATGTRMRTYATNYIHTIRDHGGSSDSFPNGSSIVEKDLYLAIHAFNYFFYGSSDSNVIDFKIADYYDFEKSNEYTNLIGHAVNFAVDAHKYGVIKYYHVNIHFSANKI